MKTPSDYVRTSNARVIAAGGRRMPSGYLKPDDAQILSELIEAGYATSPLAVITSALRDAHKKINRADRR
jgi:hypothetical protein